MYKDITSYTLFIYDTGSTKLDLDRWSYLKSLLQSLIHSFLQKCYLDTYYALGNCLDPWSEKEIYSH